MIAKSGIITKGIGGFYYVKTDDGVVECRARGAFRKKDIKPLPGDRVEIEVQDDGSGYVMSILPRINSFIRPPIANIDCFVIVAAAKNPDPDPFFIDKMLVVAESNGIDVVICFNKCDLADNQVGFANIYRNIGYKVVETEAINHKGIDEIKAYIDGKATAFVGFSGVGKSSLLNGIIDNLNLQTGDVSKKLNRGKHTTRHIELFPYNGDSYIADTPGFSMLEISSIELEDLQKYFVEFDEFTDNCAFQGCAHLAGKRCGVIAAVEEGKISSSRYDSYISLYNTLKENKERYFK